MVLGVHLNYRAIALPPNLKEEDLPKPPEVLEKLQKYGYALEQGTRPSTVGLAIGCNPMSLLAWYVDTLFESNPSPFHILSVQIRM